MDYREALSRSQSVCSRQEQCVQDMYIKLDRWGVNDSDIEKIIKQLEKEGFINELRYAASFARDKFKFNKWGRIKISWMLRQKKITEDIIEQALSEIDNEQYENLLVSELVKKMKNLKSRDKYEKKKKLIQFASQRGFESEIIYKTIDNLLYSRSKK